MRCCGIHSYCMRILILVATLSVTAHAQTDALKQINAYLNNIGIAQTAQRAATVAQITTRRGAERRQTEVRAKIVNLIGGLPDHSTPLTVKHFAITQSDGFRIENIAYESLPNFWVTANVYVPATGPGPFPAIIVTPGHGAGKSSEYNWAANLARAGIVTLVVDPLGQGERFQHYDPDIENSKIERLGEHEHASLSTLLIGEHVSRYFINDGIRGVDYLVSRKDVDPARIGAFGCSGGGTITAYLTALEPRIRVAASACYITSFKYLFPTQGPQDAEQTLPRFTAEGLDFADWVELAAPRPYAIVSTQQDMFPFAGAQETYEEAKRFYALFNAADNLQWITGPGGHGNLGPIGNQILTFLATNLKAGPGPFEFKQFRAPDSDDLTVTPTGQVSTSLDSRSVEAINRERALTKVHSDIRRTAVITAQPGASPVVKVIKEEAKDGYRFQTVSIASEPGIELTALQALPSSPGPAVILMDEIPVERTAASPDFIRLAKSGHRVVALQLRGTPVDAQSGQSAQYALGPYMALNLRAIIVGKTLVGMRTDDVIRAINWLGGNTSITLYGKGALGMVALHAAALDQRVTHVLVENTLTSYSAALDAPVHKNLSEIMIPGVLQHYDVPDLLAAIAPREVTIVNPVDAIGQPVHLQGKAIRRGFRDPLPIE